MPIYEYQCDDCHHRLEILQKISDGPVEICPECGDKNIHKLVSAVSFKLKGTGWYETDFKHQADKNAPKVDKTEKAEKNDNAGADKSKAQPSAQNNSEQT